MRVLEGVESRGLGDLKGSFPGSLQGSMRSNYNRRV